jgi:hypothetical protein
MLLTIMKAEVGAGHRRLLAFCPGGVFTVTTPL